MGSLSRSGVSGGRVSGVIGKIKRRGFARFWRRFGDIC